MTDDNLSEFLNERVLPTRQVHHVQYPLELDNPAVAVFLDCPEDAMSVVVMPTFVKGTLHMELHFFADGARTEPEVIRHIPPNGNIELVLHKPAIPDYAV